MPLEVAVSYGRNQVARATAGGLFFYYFPNVGQPPAKTTQAFNTPLRWALTKSFRFFKFAETHAVWER
jgi:hypothetical protein